MLAAASPLPKTATKPRLPTPPPETMLAQVHVFAHGKLLRKYAIEHGEYIVGRDATCHIVADADQVSRHHARLTFSAFELTIEDLGSSNGVFIEGVEVQIPTRVRSDQEVQIGSARLHIRLKEDAAQHLSAALMDADLGLEPVREMLSGAKYKVLTTIARGGMGVVMQARDLRVRRDVAMKVMKTNAQFSRENVLRFVDEAQLTGQLEHPNIIPVYELAMDEGGEAFYTMKYVKGITLDEVLRGLRFGNQGMVEKYPLGTLLTIFQKICDAVAFAHARGVVHRDLKPDNVMIGAFGEVLVMDWGLAKNMTGGDRTDDAPEEETAGAKKPEAHDPRGFKTMHGLVIGTPPYISPEQARGDLEKIDTRSDIFVLGEILYAILTLRAPIPGSTVAEVIDNLIASRITPPLVYNSLPRASRGSQGNDGDDVVLAHCPGKKIPDSLSAVVMKAMEARPEDRYQSVEEMQADITAHQGGFATKAERATLGKHFLLWAGRHKDKVAIFALFAVLFHVTILTFFFQLKRQRDRAIDNALLAQSNEQRALDSERRAAEALATLRETAPTFASDAEALIEDLRFTEALEKIDYAIEQQPEHAEYYALRGNVLQSLLRFDDARQAFEKALALDPMTPGAQQNLALTTRLLGQGEPAGLLSPVQMRELHVAMLDQNRVDEAFALLGQIATDRELFRKTILDAFGRIGLRERTEPLDDATVALDLSGLDLTKGLSSSRAGRRRGIGALRDLRNRPISSLNLDNTRIADLSVLKGWPLRTLAVNSNPVLDFSPLRGMPLRSLSADGSVVRDLSALAGMPLTSLRLRNTRVASLEPLRRLPLEVLILAGSRAVADLSPLEGAPLQQLDVSRTSISNLQPLTASPIRELNLEGCTDLIDLRPLLDMPALEAVIIPRQCKDVAFLREHLTLKRLSYKKLTQPAYEFWEEFDAR